MKSRRDQGPSRDAKKTSGRSRARLAGVVLATLVATAGCGVGIGDQVEAAKELPAPAVGITYTYSLPNSSGYQEVFAGPESTEAVPNPDPFYVTVLAGADGAQVSTCSKVVNRCTTPYTLEHGQTAKITLGQLDNGALRPLPGRSAAAITVQTVSTLAN